MSLRPLHRAAALIVIGLLIAGCSGSAASSLPGPASSEPEGTPTTVRTPDEAAARVLALDHRFAGLRAFDPNIIGGCCFYRAEATDSGYRVTIEVGWDDCPAGCINRHRWLFSVSPLGDVSLESESGPPVPAEVFPGGSAGAGSSNGELPSTSPAASDEGAGHVTTGVGIEGIALAGPTCPVVKPNDPACADRPIAGVTVHIIAADGLEVATLTTDASGRFWTDLEAGDYRVQADPVDGLIGTPVPVDVGVDDVEEVILSFDTGIR